MKINGERIRQEMKKKHITQQKLADEIGVNRTEISYWINGSRGMKAKYIYKLSKSLDIKVDEITEGKAIIFPKMVEVVRCKDCQHGEKVNSVYLCGKSRGFGLAHEPDWFCADGERW